MFSSIAPRADPVAERVEVEAEDVVQALDPGLHQELVVARARSSPG